MTTRSAMLAEMQADMGRTNTAAITAMTAKINAAIRHYQPRRFFFNESRSVTFSTVASTDLYRFGAGLEITTEFYKIDGVWVTISSTDVRELDPVDPTELEWEADNFTTTGEPSSYAFINKALRFYPNPDAIYATRLMGHVKVAAPGSDGETDNPWMTEAYDLIMCRAKAELFGHREWGTVNDVMLMTEAEKSALRSLQDATVDKMRTGFIQPQSQF